MTKDDIRYALRLACANLNIKLHNTTLAGLSRQMIKELEKLELEDNSRNSLLK